MTTILATEAPRVAPMKMMARAASVPCPECEGMRSSVLGAQPLLHACGASLAVAETREDPDHYLAPAVWRLRVCPADSLELATVQFLVTWVKGDEPQDARALAPGERLHRCDDCGATFSTLERPVSLDEARERLAHLARERVMLARAGRRQPVGVR